jgi:hypothetical protein
MIGWAMGSATAHIAMAMWRDGELYMCESNGASPYWPINGIQCNKYDTWIQYALAANYNVVWAPLSRKATFNETAAWEFIENHLGIDYGWEIVLMGYLDSHEGNRVCADNAGTMCTEKEHWELLFSVAEKVRLFDSSKLSIE